MNYSFFVQYVLCLTSLQVAYGAYFVLLKNNETLQNFLAYDTTYPVFEQVQVHIEDSYRIGDSAILSGNFPELHLLRLRRCPLVAEITPEITFKAFEWIEQERAPRHLAALSNEMGYHPDQRSYFFQDEAKGSDVIVYVIDGGIYRKGYEFAGRIIAGVDFTNEKQGPADIHGHGTHVAGIIGSETFGVAKNVSFVILKVLDKHGQGSLTLIISALEFAVNHHRQSGLPGIVNLSLGAPYSALINRVVDSVSRAGLVVVVAAGNSSKDACFVLPASANLAITVGAIDDITSKIAPFSNWGPCVDIFASGVNVASVSVRNLRRPQFHRLSRNRWHVYSGTSMAAPVVSGLIANLLSMGVHAEEAKAHLLDMAVEGRIPREEFESRPETPNRVVNNGYEAGMYLDGSDSDLNN